MLTRNTVGSRKSKASSLAHTSKLLFLLAVLFVSAPFLRAQTTPSGIAGYDLMSSADLAISFDYTDSGSADHLLFYRPGTGVAYVVQKNTGANTYTTVFASSHGIGSYDLLSPADRIIAFDYNGSGYKDHLIAYRPGTGGVQIIANNGGTFTTVFSSSTGIGSFDLRSPADWLLPFDYEGQGIANYLVAYRPGTGVIQILKNMSAGSTPGSFALMFSSTSGIGGYDLMSPADRICAYDYNSVGSEDHLVLYRPGTGTVYIVGNYNGTFTADYASTSGIGGYDLLSTADLLVPMDFNGSGFLDHILAYRPGTGTAYVLGSAYFSFSPAFESTTGIAGYDLKAPMDRIITFDASGSGLMKDLVMYRPGTGAIEITTNTSGTFASTFQSF